MHPEKLKQKTFRTTQTILDLIKQESQEKQVSESEVVVMALQEYFGLSVYSNSEPHQLLLDLQEKLDRVIEKNNLQS